MTCWATPTRDQGYTNGAAITLVSPDLVDFTNLREMLAADEFAVRDEEQVGHVIDHQLLGTTSVSLVR